MKRLLAALVTIGACGGSSPVAAPTPPPVQSPAPVAVRVLMLTATAGFRHDSIGTARETLTSLATASNAFTIRTTEQVSAIDATALATVDVLMFALTTGELPFTSAQKEAIVAFVNNGGGFIGVHSATDTLYSWEDYGRIVGAYFKEHPWTQEASVSVEDRDHAISSGVATPFRLLEEFYTFRQNPRPSVHVVLSLDPASVNATGDFPLAWTQTIGRGRSYYNALGHFDSTWREPWFQRQIVNAIRWAAQR